MASWLNSAKSKLGLNEEKRPTQKKKPLEPKTKPEEPSNVIVPLIPNPNPLQEQQTMSKPESYYSIRQEGTKEKPEYYLFDGEDKVTVTYSFGRYNAQGTKGINLAALKEIAKSWDLGVNEGNAKYKLKEMNLSQLVDDLKAHKVEILDFFQWVKENLPEKERKAREAGTRITSNGVKLASIINKMADMKLEGDRPNLQMRLEALEALMTEETKTAALKHLEEKLNDPEYGWNKTEKMSVVVKGIKKEVANPAYGQVILKASK